MEDERMLRRYRRRADAIVTAVRLELETDGFVYRKWGSVQSCKRGDWLVDNCGDIYSVDGDSFEKSYRLVTPGRYVKHVCVWARVAPEDGVIRTKEGMTQYQQGDFLVFNEPDETDGYAIRRETFHRLYEQDEGL